MSEIVAIAVLFLVVYLAIRSNDLPSVLFISFFLFSLFYVSFIYYHAVFEYNSTAPAEIWVSPSPAQTTFPDSRITPVVNLEPERETPVQRNQRLKKEEAAKRESEAKMAREKQEKEELAIKEKEKELQIKRQASEDEARKRDHSLRELELQDTSASVLDLLFMIFFAGTWV
jgi:hypothetical protein